MGTDITGRLGMPLTEREVAHAVASGLQGVHVLLVEDSWQVADALKLLLEKTGMVVSGPVATVKEAQDLAAENAPRLAIVDVNLKGEMAYALMDWLHARGIQVLVISGYADLPRSLGQFAAILHKPFTATALLTTLRRMNQRHSTP
jgi:DNA-binding response OmpR family regulator